MSTPNTRNITLADRFHTLGTETAYAVSGEAAAHKAAGNRVFAFHIGDLNFETPQCIKKAAQQAMADNKTGYCPALGVQALRQSLAEFLGNERGVEFGAENVAIQPGGKPVIGKWLQVLMNPGDHVMGPAPGYPIYESLVTYFGGEYRPYYYREQEDGTFALDMDSFKSQYTEKTKLLIYNNYHNPSGAASSVEEMQEVADFAIAHDLLVLSDEAYFHLVFDDKPRSIVALPGMKERTTILFTCSKSWAMTGWRVGAAVGPKTIIDAIGKIATNDEACTCHPVQYAAVSAVTNPEAMAAVKTTRDELQQRRDLLHSLLNEVPGISAGKPPSTFYIVANCTKAMEMTKTTSLEDFRKLLLKDTGVSVCTREHFGPTYKAEGDSKYIRFAYSGISQDDIKEAAKVLKEYFEKLQ